MAATKPQKPPPLLLRNIAAVDTKISHTIHSLFNSYLPSAVLLLLELSADFRFSFPLSLSLLFFSPPPSLFALLSPLLLGLLLDLVVVGAVKILFRRPRPVHNHRASMSVAVSADHYSFPSGHASRVFFVSSLIFLSSASLEAALYEARDREFVGKWIDNVDCDVVVTAVAAWAALTAFSRVLLGRHYVLDVVAGACLGVIEGSLAFRYFRFEGFLR